MKTPRRLSLSLAISLVALTLGGAAVFASGSGTASGTVSTKGQVDFGRVGKDAGDVPAWGKVTIDKVTVLDKFGHEKQVTWRVVGGAGTSRPTIKFTPPLENGDYVRLDLTTTEPKTGTKDWGYVGMHLY